VDDCVKATELVDLVGNGPRAGDGEEVSSDSSPGTGRRLQSVATSIVIAPVQDNLMTLLDQEPGRHQTEAVR
jgi:hypothetical protein